MQQQWRNFKTELQEKPLLAVSVVFIGLLAWLTFYLWLLDVIAERQRELRLEQTFYNELLANADDDSLFTLRDQMALALTAHRDQARRGTSEGLLQASFADDIRSVLRAHQLSGAEINVEIRPAITEPSWPSDLRVMSARVSVRGDRRVIMESWIQLSEQMPGIWFESFTVGDMGTPLVEWQMATLYILESQ